MIIEITKDNLKELNDSFFSKKWVEKELSSNPYAKFLILIENKEIIGYLYYSDIYERTEINQFEIKNIHRNCGKGNLLLTEFLKTVKKDVTLEVREDNLAAIKLYKKHGFLKKAIRKNYYKEKDGILMERVWKNSYNNKL